MIASAAATARIEKHESKGQRQEGEAVGRRRSRVAADREQHPGAHEQEHCRDRWSKVRERPGIDEVARSRRRPEERLLDRNGEGRPSEHRHHGHGGQQAADGLHA
ncbi:MAG TPA: hypothetical protein VN605_11130, partial [Thermoanaerobaculia bacterium]|nr:hypothetical protein [Thermoanaerobaculia bacterium]